MQLSTRGAAFTRTEEGFVDHYYLDPGGVGTIGEGFTWASSSFKSWWGTNKPGVKFGPGATMTRDEADACLIYISSQEYGRSVNAFFESIPGEAQNVWDGVHDVVYNCGAGTLNDKWAAALKSGDVAGAVKLLLTTRITQKGTVLAGLKSRRSEEGQLIQTGDYTIGDYSTSAPAAPRTELRLGDRGSDVAALQKRLAEWSLYSGVVDGIFGHGTQAAVLAAQATLGLSRDGIAGPVTNSRLAGAIVAGSPGPAATPTTPAVAPAAPSSDAGSDAVPPTSAWEILFQIVASLFSALAKHTSHN